MPGSDPFSHSVDFDTDDHAGVAGGRDQTERFLGLLLAHQRRVHAYILSLVPNRSDADDLLQETIVALWRKFDCYEPGTDFLAWAVAVARYEVLKFRQKHARSKLLFSEELMGALAQSVELKVAEFDDRHTALETCLGKLAARDRELIALRYQEGLTIKAVALRVGRPIAGMYKAMSRIHDALTLCVRGSMKGDA